MTAKMRRRGLSIHAAADARLARETDFFRHSEEQLAAIRLGAEMLRLGCQTRLLVRDAGGFSLLHASFKPNFELPRHTHNTDCMYYVLAGSAVLGTRTLWAGDSFFIPANAPYQYNAGPEGVEVLEIRHGDRSSDMTIVEPLEEWERRAARTVEANREAWASLSATEGKTDAGT